MRRTLTGLAVAAVGLTATGVAIGQISGGVPSANPRSGTPADILAHHARVRGARDIRPGQLPAPVDMRAPKANQLHGRQFRENIESYPRTSRSAAAPTPVDAFSKYRNIKGTSIGKYK